MHAVDRYAYGLVPRGKAYAAQILKTDARTVEALLKAELTEIVGEEIMVAERCEGSMYIITGVSKHLTQLQFAAALRRSPLKWSVRPEPNPDRRNMAYNVHKVFALTPPTKTCVRLNDAGTGNSSLARIIPLVDTFKNTKRGFGGMAELGSSDVGILRE